MRILVCGGRNYGDARHEWNVIRSWVTTLDPDDTMIIHGAATGADEWAAKIAHNEGIPTCGFPARWDIQRKAAGPIRNKRMLDVAEPHLVVAFPGGRGTANMVKQAKARGIEVQEISAVL